MKINITREELKRILEFYFKCKISVNYLDCDGYAVSFETDETIKELGANAQIRRMTPNEEIIEKVQEGYPKLRWVPKIIQKALSLKEKEQKAKVEKIEKIIVDNISNPIRDKLLKEVSKIFGEETEGGRGE